MNFDASKNDRHVIPADSFKKFSMRRRPRELRPGDATGWCIERWGDGCEQRDGETEK